MNAKTGFACKEAGRQVLHFKQEKWSKKAKSLCYDGIKQKYLENQAARCTLLSTKNKTIVECTKDSVWGCGKPLADETCLDKSMWVNQGIMGEILESIRQELESIAPSNPNADDSSNDSSSSDESSSDSSTSDDDDIHVKPSSAKPPIMEQSESM